MSNKPTPLQISRVMSELGRRNKGKPKKLTPAGIAQRRKAGKASARLRKLKWRSFVRHKALGDSMESGLPRECHGRISPVTPRHTPENIAPLAQPKAEK